MTRSAFFGIEIAEIVPDETDDFADGSTSAWIYQD
jgi:hypothetical protein